MTLIMAAPASSNLPWVGSAHSDMLASGLNKLHTILGVASGLLAGGISLGCAGSVNTALGTGMATHGERPLVPMAFESAAQPEQFVARGPQYAVGISSEGFTLTLARRSSQTSSKERTDSLSLNRMEAMGPSAARREAKKE